MAKGGAKVLGYARARYPCANFVKILKVWAKRSPRHCGHFLRSRVQLAIKNAGLQSMKCPYCGMHFSDNWIVQEIARLSRTGWFYRTALCPECTQMTIELCPPLRSDIMNQLDQLSVGEQHTTIQRLGRWRQVLPVGSNRGPVPPEVPKAIAADYVEACRVLPTSAKASAALSRRCLQTMLHAHGYKDRDLAKEIQQLLNANVLPQHIQETVDAIRNFGNFSAHPINDKTSLQVIDVDPEEAGWCLEILEALFDHFYVGPEKAKARKAALNKKLAAAGKPPSK